MAVETVCLQEMGAVFVVSMPFTVSLFACAMIDHSGFTNLLSNRTPSTVILLPHLHLSVCCVRGEIWCATRHAWLRVWSEGIRLILVHATLLTLATICVLRREPWSCLSAQCTPRVSTLLSHHLFASTRNGGYLNMRCVSLSSPFAYRGGGVGCVSSLSSPQGMKWPVVVRRGSCSWVFDGWHHQDMPI